MRGIGRLAVVVAGALLMAGCGPSRGGGVGGPVGPPSRPPILRLEPGCPYRVVGTIEVEWPSALVPVNAIHSRARSMGAYAVVMLSHTLSYADGRPNGSRWTGHGIAFSNPNDPECYSR